MKIKQRFSVQYQYDILFTENVFASGNTMLQEVLTASKSNSTVKVVFVIDQGLSDHLPDLVPQIQQYFADHEHITLSAQPLIVKGGEETKNSLEEFDKSIALINSAGIDRHSFVIAVGGGAVLDMVGFAAAVGHRGVKHIRIPTTVLSQSDSGIGVKNGINYFGKKNFLGSFAPPFAVINDTLFLQTASDRDWKSGIAESIKVALIKDKTFFTWLEENTESLRKRDLASMKELIFRCASLHGDHIAQEGDPFEQGSSRPLDFGHWSAHKLEQLTSFETKHGEAVAMGLALDICYAREAGYLDSEIRDQILKLIENCGLDIFHPLFLNQTAKRINPDLLQGLEEFREHLGGELTITMINEIGAKFDVHDMNADWIEQAALFLGNRQAFHVSRK